MADKKVFEPAQQNIDSLVDNGMISPETAALFPQQPEAIPPATSENQYQTEQAIEASKANDALATDPVPTQALEDEQLLQASEDLKNQASLQGPAIEVAEELIKQDQKTQEESQKIKDAIDIKDQTEQNKEVIKSQMAANEAMAQTQIEKQKDLQKQADSIQAEIKKEQEELKNMSMEDMFDGDQAPISRTRAIIAIMLGGLGQGLAGGANQGLIAVNRIMDNHFEKQKLTAKERLSKKQRIYDLIKLDLQKQSQATDDEMKKARIAQIQSQMEQGKMSTYQAQQAQLAKQGLAKRLASQEGLTKEEVFSLDPKLQEKAVFFSDGNARFANSMETAKKIRNEILPSSKDAIRGITRLKELSENFAGGSLSLEARAEAQTIQQALKGALRLELFGPGVMTDTEQKLADKIIGNPTSLTALSSIERKKLDTLMNKIVQGTKEKLRISGIDLPESNNEKKLKQLLKNNKNLTKQQAMSALIERGFWDKEESQF